MCSLTSTVNGLNLKEDSQILVDFRYMLLLLLYDIMVRHGAASCARFDGHGGLYFHLQILDTILFREHTTYSLEKWSQILPAQHAVKAQRHQIDSRIQIFRAGDYVLGNMEDRLQRSKLLLVFVREQGVIKADKTTTDWQ